MPLCSGCEPVPYQPVIYFITLIFGGFFLRWYMQGGKFKKPTRIDGKIVIITGANAGIGKETAIELARRGGKIYMACRSLERANKACEEIRKQSGNQNVFVRELDLSSFESIRKFADGFKKEEKTLDILINNAGIMACPKSYTTDGLESQMGTNHIGHFLLTHLLLDLIKNAQPSRIVNLSSRAHFRGKINKEDLNSDESYEPMVNYSQSKLANVLFTKELARRLKDTKVTVNCLHPGVVDTELFKHFDTPRNGAQTSIYAALDPDLNNVTGKYFADCKIISSSKLSEDENLAKWLYDRSEKITGVSNKAN